MAQILSIALHTFEASADFFFGPDPVSRKMDHAHYRAEEFLVMAR